MSGTEIYNYSLETTSLAQRVFVWFLSATHPVSFPCFLVTMSGPVTYWFIQERIMKKIIDSWLHCSSRHNVFVSLSSSGFNLLVFWCFLFSIIVHRLEIMKFRSAQTEAMCGYFQGWHFFILFNLIFPTLETALLVF